MKKYILLFLISGLLIASYYFIFSKEEWDDRNIRQKVTPTQKLAVGGEITEDTVKREVFYALPERALNPEFGGKVFCASKIFGYDKSEDNKYLHIYVYTYCEEYYLKNGEVELGSGVSYPARLIYSNASGGIEYYSIDIPENGEGFADSIKKIFPEKFQKEATNGIDVSTLTPSPKTQAENYFSGRLEVYF